ncbi:MAG: 2'-5' RNA ligase family protein [Ferruginibacter sp.]
MNLQQKNTLIITLKIDDESQVFFNAQRKAYFPAYANFAEAHLTLFHKLPNDNKLIFETLENSMNIKAFKMLVKSIINNKNFIAYEIDSEVLQNLHNNMQIDFANYINKKDKEILWPHITIQNKATVYKAQKTHQKLLETFIPFNITAIGISVWYYNKKCWQKFKDYLFLN